MQPSCYYNTNMPAQYSQLTEWDVETVVGDGVDCEIFQQY